MEIEGRILDILAAVVEIHIETTKPVGSQTICKRLNFEISPATVRNKMASLFSVGLLEQPHVSSGRIPSQTGYRVYVDNFSGKYKLSAYEMSIIDAKLRDEFSDPEKIINNAAEILAEVTNCTVVFTALPSKSSCVQDIKFVKLGQCSAMIILITSNGIIKNKVFNCKFKINNEILKIFVQVVGKFIGQPLTKLIPESLKIISSCSGTDDIIIPAIEALSIVAKDASLALISIKGEQNLFSDLNFKLDDALKIWRFLNKKEEISNFLFNENSNAIILIGTEIGRSELACASILRTSYLVNESVGIIAVIGPMRLNYNNIISKLDYISKSVEDVLVEVLG
ncbi:MAG: heat-inducible transcription repressor HrcA [Candidatus Improbicoccus devescovinae]|nr:MAG: heat-inducible transcription repressor HrcA [Candidatus Improbicoccus devescovinae]